MASPQVVTGVLRAAGELMRREGGGGVRVMVGGGSYLAGDGTDWLDAIRRSAPGPFHPSVTGALRRVVQYLLERENAALNGWQPLDMSESVEALTHAQLERAVANLWNEIAVKPGRHWAVVLDRAAR